MAKYDKMVEKIKEQSREKQELAIRTLENMYKKKEAVTVSELVKRTGLSRNFFYSNDAVYQQLIAIRTKQKTQRLRFPKHEEIEKAQAIRIQQLEKALKDSVSKKDYEELKQKYEQLQSNNLFGIIDSL